MRRKSVSPVWPAEGRKRQEKIEIKVKNRRPVIVMDAS
jgi:hypothetical protein